MVLMEWTDHSRRRFESWRISILQEMVTEYRNQWLPCFWLSSFDRYSPHNRYYVACFWALLYGRIVASFSGRPAPATNRESPEGRGEGSEGFAFLLRPLLVDHPRVAVSFLWASG